MLNYFRLSACDGWMTKEHIPPTKSSWSTLEASEARIRMEKSRLVTISSHEPSQFNSVEWKVQKFYGSCMALGFIDIDREKPLVKIINSLGGWEVLRSFNLYSWDSHRVLRELHAEHNVDAFFRLGVAPDSRDPGRAVITVSPGGLGMPHRSYYHRLPDDPAVAAYQTFLKDSAQLFGASSPDAHKFSVDMFNFEKRLSEITPEADYLSDPSRTSNHMSVKDLHTVSMNIPWLEILKAAYPEAPMSEETEVVVVSPQYVADIAVIMSTTDRASLNNYLMWRLVQSYMPFLSKTYREVVDLYRKALEGAQKPLERWEFCQLTTEHFFGQLLGSMYTKEQPQLRERTTLVNKLFDYIKHNVAKAMSVSSAYDYSSRRAAMSKLQNMSIQVGTPDFLMDAKYLKLLYKDLLVQKTDFFQNIQYGVMFLRKRQEMTLVSPSEESRWVDLLLDWRRVGYSPSANKVVVPESFLLPPFFHVGYPNSVNLGGLGVRLAEAVISGVAGHGLLFNADGVLQVGPGQNATSSGSLGRPLLAFEEEARCLTERLSSLGVDTPDFLRKCQHSAAVQVSALRQTLASLQDILELERGQILPALEERDPPALFFLSHAQTLCEQKSIRRRDVDRAIGQQLLGKERLAAELAQVPQFSHFYFCPEEEGEEEEGVCRGIM